MSLAHLFFICYLTIGSIHIGWMALVIHRHSLPFSTENILGILISGLCFPYIWIKYLLNDED
jgi:hypothetical protein